MLPHCAGGDGGDTQHPVQSQPSVSKDAQSLMLSVADIVPHVLIWHVASQPSIAGRRSSTATGLKTAEATAEAKEVRQQQPLSATRFGHQIYQLIQA